MIKSDQNQHFLYFGVIVWRMSGWIKMKGYPFLAPPPYIVGLCPGGEIVSIKAQCDVRSVRQ